MKIGVNNLDEVKQIGEITDVSLKIFEVDRERVFGGLSDAQILICSYKEHEYGFVVSQYMQPNTFELVEPVMDTAALNFVALAQAGIHDAVTAAEHADLFIEWQSGYTCAAKTIVREGGQLYQAMHDVDAGQAIHTPSTAPSLWKRIADPAEEWPAWSPPSGGHDAYDVGAKVTHMNKRWISQMPANIIEPGSPPPVEGYWTEVTP